MSSSNEAAHQDPDHNPDILKRAADLKKKLQGPHLTPNQRKKLRKRLSRLFQPDGGMASDDSAQVEQSDDISRQTDETAAPSVCSHPLSPSHNAPHQHHDSNPDMQGSKRRKLGNLASCVAGSGSHIPPGSSTKAHSRMHGSTLNNAVISEDKSGPSHLPSYTARLSHNSASIVPEALPGASDDSRCTLQVPTRAAPRTLHGSIPHPSLHSKALQQSSAHALELKTSAAPVSIQQRRVPPNDFSSIMQLIAVQLRTSVAPPLKLVPEASAIASSGRPSGAHFCRRDMSQEVSVISAELSLSGVVAGEICSKVKRGHDLISPPDNPHIMQESKSSPDRSVSQHTVDVTAVQAGSTKELEQSAEPSAAGAGDGVAGKAKSKKKQKVYPHGNYHNYYGYRALGSFDEDPRLKLFKEEWFLNRDVLDVGCNEGLITLAVAARYKCKSVMGVDIDGTLIKRAKSNLREMRSRLSQQLNGYSGHQQGSSTRIAANSHAAQLVSCIFKPSREVRWISPARKSSSTCAELQVIPSDSSDSCVPGDADVATGIETGNSSITKGGDLMEYNGSTNLGKAPSAHPLSGLVPVIMQESSKMPEDSALLPPVEGAHVKSLAPHSEPSQQPNCLGTQDASFMKPAPLNRSGVDPLVGGRFDDRHRQVGHLRHALKTLNKTRFKKQDWSKGRSKEESYDTIMCLSVTKWIHLNGGDAALKSFFKKVYSSLTPGGLLVLEPQPWRSYRSAIHKQQTCNVPFRRIEQLQLRPDGFLTFLTDKVGFTVVADLNAGNTAHHFDRPLYILQRPYDGNPLLV